MDMDKSSCVQEISREVDITPEEYIIGVLKPADESFKQGMQDVVEGNTRPVSELWKGVE